MRHGNQNNPPTATEAMTQKTSDNILTPVFKVNINGADRLGADAGCSAGRAGRWTVETLDIPAGNNPCLTDDTNASIPWLQSQLGLGYEVDQPFA